MVRVMDADGYAEITVNVTVAAVNDAPEILEGDAVTVSMSEDGTPTAFNLTLNAVDIDGGALTWSISASASHGMASMVSGDTLSYAPNANYNGSDSFVVQVSDGNGGVDTITVNVTIDAVNDTPEITEGASIAVSMSEDGSPTPFSLTLHATDIEGDTLTWSISIPATYGTADASDTDASQAITYTPHADYNGSDSFVVQVSDGNGGVDTIMVNVTIEAVNDAPVNTTMPSISGTLQVGNLLTANPGSWNDTLDTAVSGSSTLSYAYQWQRADDAGTQSGRYQRRNHCNLYGNASRCAPLSPGHRHSDRYRGGNSGQPIGDHLFRICSHRQYWPRRSLNHLRSRSPCLKMGRRRRSV